MIDDSVRLGFGQRKAPAHVLQKLREIDPNADLVYLGQGEWLLGVRAENNAARKRAERLLGTMQNHSELTDPVQAAEQAKRIELLLLYAQGFRPVHIYDTPEESVEDFRERDYRYRNAFNETLRHREKEAQFGRTPEEEERDFYDYAEELRSLHRYFLRGARGFLQRVSIFN